VSPQRHAGRAYIDITHASIAYSRIPRSEPLHPPPHPVSGSSLPRRAAGSGGGRDSRTPPNRQDKGLLRQPHGCEGRLDVSGES